MENIKEPLPLLKVEEYSEWQMNDDFSHGEKHQPQNPSEALQEQTGNQPCGYPQNYLQGKGQYGYQDPRTTQDFSGTYYQQTVDNNTQNAQSFYQGEIHLPSSDQNKAQFNGGVFYNHCMVGDGVKTTRPNTQGWQNHGGNREQLHYGPLENMY